MQALRYKSLRFLGLSRYRVGTDGSIWARGWTKRNPQYEWRQLRGSPDNRRFPYPIVNLVNDKGIWRRYRLHILVLTAFIGHKPPGMEACHNDGNPANCQLSNLRWDTPSANQRDKELHGTSNHGTRNGRSVLDENKVKLMRALYATGSYSSIGLARMFGVGKTTAGLVLTGQTWKQVL